MKKLRKFESLQNLDTFLIPDLNKINLNENLEEKPHFTNNGISFEMNDLMEKQMNNIIPEKIDQDFFLNIFSKIKEKNKELENLTIFVDFHFSLIFSQKLNSNFSIIFIEQFKFAYLTKFNLNDKTLLKETKDKLISYINNVLEREKSDNIKKILHFFFSSGFDPNQKNKKCFFAGFSGSSIEINKEFHYFLQLFRLNSYSRNKIRQSLIPKIKIDNLPSILYHFILIIRNLLLPNKKNEANLFGKQIKENLLKYNSMLEIESQENYESNIKKIEKLIKIDDEFDFSEVLVYNLGDISNKIENSFNAQERLFSDIFERIPLIWLENCSNFGFNICLHENSLLFNFQWNSIIYNQLNNNINDFDLKPYYFRIIQKIIEILNGKQSINKIKLNEENKSQNFKDFYFKNNDFSFGKNFSSSFEKSKNIELINKKDENILEIPKKLKEINIIYPKFFEKSNNKNNENQIGKLKNYYLDSFENEEDCLKFYEKFLKELQSDKKRIEFLDRDKCHSLLNLVNNKLKLIKNSLTNIFSAFYSEKFKIFNDANLSKKTIKKYNFEEKIQYSIAKIFEFFLIENSSINLINLIKIQQSNEIKHQISDIFFTFIFNPFCNSFNNLNEFVNKFLEENLEQIYQNFLQNEKGLKNYDLHNEFEFSILQKYFQTEYFEESFEFTLNNYKNYISENEINYYFNNPDEDDKFIKTIFLMTFDLESVKFYPRNFPKFYQEFFDSFM